MASVSTTADGETSAEGTRTGTDTSWRRIVFGAGVGNTLEWYDWSVYAVFAPFFARQFFNADSAVSAMLSTLAVFAVGFVMRPLGGIFFGWFADRLGRRRAMVLSMAVTALGSLLIAVAPTYSDVGLVASALLLFARLAQGFGIGGEIGASHTYLAEAAPAHRRGLWSSSMYVAVTIGVLFATVQAAVLQSVLDSEQMNTWGWRIPFAIGAVLGIYAFYLRRGLPETTAFRNAHADPPAGKQPMLRGIWQNRAAVLRVVGLTVGGTVLFYTWAIGATSYAITVKGIDPDSALWAGVIANLVYIAALPAWGAVSDRWGRRPNVIVFCVGLAVLSFPLNWLIQDSAWQLCLAISVALLVHASVAAILPALFAEMFPARVRASGMALPYSFAVAATGGTAPYLRTYLAEAGMPSVFTWYAIALLAVGLVVAVRMPETRGRDLT